MAKGMPSLTFRDTRGTTRAFIGLGPEGSGVVTMSDQDQTPRLGILNDQDDPNLFMLDKKGRTTWAAAAETPPHPSRPQATHTPTRHRRRPASILLDTAQDHLGLILRPKGVTGKNDQAPAQKPKRARKETAVAPAAASAPRKER